MSNMVLCMFVLLMLEIHVVYRFTHFSGVLACDSSNHVEAAAFQRWHGNSVFELLHFKTQLGLQILNVHACVYRHQVESSMSAFEELGICPEIIQAVEEVPMKDWPQHANCWMCANRCDRMTGCFRPLCSRRCLAQTVVEAKEEHVMNRFGATAFKTVSTELHGRREIWL